MAYLNKQQPSANYRLALFLRGFAVWVAQSASPVGRLERGVGERGMASLAVASGSTVPLNEQVRQNIRVFYNPATDIELRNKANAWLNSYQLTEQAWEISHAVLTKRVNQEQTGESFIPEEVYFSANTLHKKARHDTSDLSLEQVNQLRSSLLNLCFSTKLPSNVVTRLALAYVALPAHRSAVEPTANPLEPIFSLNLFERDGGSSMVLAAVEIFSVVLEESTDDVLPIDQHVRDNFVGLLRTSGVPVLQFLYACLQRLNGPQKAEGMSSMLMERVFRCMSSWVKYGDLSPDTIASSPLLRVAFEVLATDTIVHMLRRYCYPDTDAVLIQAIVPLVMSLGPRLATDDAEDVARILTEMGESFMRIICGPVEMGQANVVSVLADAINHDDIEVASMTIPFWYHMSYVLVKCVEDMKAGDGNGETIQLRERRLREFSPHLGRVAGACFKHMPACIGSNVPGEEDHELRTRFGECLEDCCNLLGWSICLNEARNYLQHTLNSPSPSVDAVLPALHCLYFILKVEVHRHPDENEIVPALLQILPALFPGDSRVKKIGMEIVGICAKWIDSHADTLNQLFPYVVSGLQTKPAASTAARNLRTLCRVCINSIPPSVLSVYDSTMQVGLSHQEQQQIIEGMSAIVSRLPFEQAGQGLQRLLSPMVGELSQLLHGQDVEMIVSALDRMVAVFRYAKLKCNLPSNAMHPAIMLMNEVWQIFEQLILRFNTNGRIMEKVARVYKHAIRNAGPFFLPLLDKLLVQIVEVVSKCPISSFIYTCSICVSEFGDKSKDPAVRSRLMAAYGEMTKSMCLHLTNAEAFINSPTLVEDYFNLSNRLARKAPDLFLSTKNEVMLHTTLDTGVLGLRLDHPAAWPNVAIFFETILNLGVDVKHRAHFGQRVMQLLLTHGLKIVQSLLFGLSGGIDPRYIDDESNVSIAGLLFLTLQLDGTGSMLTELFSQTCQAGLENIAATPANIEAFSTDLVRSSSERDVFQTTFTFHRLCCDNLWKSKRAAAKATIG